MSSAWKKFTLLLWKNWTLQKRHKIRTLMELILPLVFTSLLVVVRSLATSSSYHDPTLYPPLQVDKLPPYLVDNKQDMGSITALMDAARQDSSGKLREALQKMLKGIPFEVFANQDFLKLRPTGVTVGYTPITSLTDVTMNLVKERLSPSVKIKGFNSEDELLEWLEGSPLQIPSSRRLAGIVFTSNVTSSTFGKQIAFTVRPHTPHSIVVAFRPPALWYTSLTFPVFQSLGPRNKEYIDGGFPGYYYNGFLMLQHAISMAITQVEVSALNRTFQSEISETPSGNPLGRIKTLSQRMPYVPYLDDGFLVVLQGWLPLVIMLSFIYPSINIVRSIVIEKERRLKESMKMMGLPNWLHWTAWYIKSFFMLFLSIILMTALLVIDWYPAEENVAVLSHSNFGVIFLFLLLYMNTTICFCFMISSFFSKANSGATAAGVLFFITFIPYNFLYLQYSNLQLHQKLALAPMFSTAMGFGGMLIAKWEGTAEGVQWYNINEEVSPDDSLKLIHIFAILVLDAILYLIMAWYLETVFPGEYGIPRPWYFPLQLEYWTGRSCFSSGGHKVKDVEHGLVHDPQKQEFFEPEPTGAKVGIELKKLGKVYSNGKRAVNGITLNMFEGQITALLGHNGAGKTTTISMLIGLFPASSGTARVNGFDIRSEIGKVRGSLGICPQHDVLFDELTVSEHLRFFCTLKGFKGSYKQEIEKMLDILQLQDKKDAWAKTLSGGMKRKLSVGIALCGGSKVVLLDEPTGGMDPSARRSTWELLQKERLGRTMVLTTHFMDEADLLGDRIAIMAKGSLQCYGTSLFLKRKYGAGYHLVLVKQENCIVNNVTKVIRQYIPNVELHQNVGAELSYVLPNESCDQFEALFTKLEDSKSELRISGYGASVTTMEEVFIRVGEQSDPLMKAELKDLSERNKQRTSNRPHDDMQGHDNAAFTGDHLPGTERQNEPEYSTLNISADVSTIASSRSARSTDLPELMVDSLPSMIYTEQEQFKRNTGLVLFFQQIWAMLIKKLLYTYRNWFLCLIQMSLPLFFLVMSLLVMRSFPGLKDDPPLELSLKSFPGSVTTFWQPPSNRSTGSAVSGFDMYLNGTGTSTRLEYLDTGAFDSLDDYFLKQQNVDLPGFNRYFISSIRVDDQDEKITAVYNNQPFHASGITMALVDQTLLRMLTKDPEYRLSVTNHPSPLSGDTRLELQLNGQSDGFQIAFNTTFGMSFLAAAFVLFLVKELGTKAKHLQYVSGLSFPVYWIATFIWDYWNFVNVSFGLLGALFLFQQEGFIETETQFALLIVFLLYGYVMLSQTYLLSFCFTVPSSAFTRVTLINIFSGLASMVIVAVLRVPTLDLVDVANLLDWIFLVIPSYSMGMGMSNVYSNYQGLKFCRDTVDGGLCELLQAINQTNPCCKDLGNCGPLGCVYWTKDYFAPEKLGVGRELLFMLVVGTAGYIFLILLELNILKRIRYIYSNFVGTHSFMLLHKDEEDTNDVVMDSDVLSEKNRILNNLFSPGSDEPDVLIIKNMTKFYDKNFLVVDRLCLGVPRGECFGLLGINGAGKTTTFKMLTGDELVSWGDAFLMGFSVRSDIKQVHRNIGYCPQFDALIDQMTGRETLTMYSRLRGIPEGKIKFVTTRLAKDLYLSEHMDKKVGEYSGGNKRKLSAAVALIGDPPVVFLDEPTTGMDPVARRLLWDVISRVCARGQSVILTSHSMEECEALCTRLAIMVNGQFKCIGSPQHLKNKFGSGYTLIIKVNLPEEPTTDAPVKRPSSVLGRSFSRQSMSSFTSQTRPNVTNTRIQAVKDFVQSSLPGSVLKSVHHGLLHYQVSNERLSWAHIFGTMERAKTTLGIEDYSVGQTTLEQVFLNFARSQREHS